MLEDPQQASSGPAVQTRAVSSPLMGGRGPSLPLPRLTTLSPPPPASALGHLPSRGASCLAFLQFCPQGARAPHPRILPPACPLHPLCSLVPGPLLAVPPNALSPQPPQSQGCPV